MHCERAQEFFSDYLERMLDHPMTVALESHLGTCPGCRDEVEALQDTLLALGAVPEVEPPWDGAWRVMSGIRAAQQEQLEARRPRTPGFFQWLRTLSPTSAAMGAGLATLVCAGTFALPRVFPGVKLGFVPARAAGTAATPRAELPTVQASYQADRQQVDILITPASELPGAQVRLEMGSQHVDAGGVTLSPEHPLRIPVVLPSTGREAEAVWMTVSSPARDRSYRYLIVVPMRQRTEERVTTVLENRPVDEALRQLVPYLGRPVVVSGGADGTVSLGVDGESPRRCLDQVAGQMRDQVTVEADSYRLTPQP